MKENPSVILYDGYCNLCNGSVHFVIRRDRKNKFRYASLDSDAGRSLLSSAVIDKQGGDSIVYLENEKIFLRSTAVLRILLKLGRGWQIFYILILIPPFIRDPLYKMIARSRHRWFGRSGVCYLVAPQLQYKHNSENT